MVVELAGVSGRLELVLLESVSPDTPAGDDLHLELGVEAGGFSGAHDSWIHHQDWVTFTRGVTLLERERRGRAVLNSMSPNELELELFSIDSAGHMAVRGALRRPSARWPMGIEFGFEFEPDRLVGFLDALNGFADPTDGTA